MELDKKQLRELQWSIMETEQISYFFAINKRFLSIELPNEVPVTMIDDLYTSLNALKRFNIRDELKIFIIDEILFTLK